MHTIGSGITIRKFKKVYFGNKCYLCELVECRVNVKVDISFGVEYL